MKDWVWNIFIMITSLAFIELILPGGSMQKYLKFVLSLFIIAVIIYPFGKNIAEEISLSLPVGDDSTSSPYAGDDELLKRIINTQTYQLEEVYLQKMKDSGLSPNQRQNPGISLPWTDIYSNDEEESN